MTDRETARAIHTSRFARNSYDHYATPAWVTEALLRHTTLRGPIWEPCCGTGVMAETLAAAGHEVVASDLHDHGYGTVGIDLLACQTMRSGCRSLVTNPPYGDASPTPGQRRSPTALLEFLRHVLALTKTVDGQLALLVRLQWIAGQRAAALLSDAPLTATVVLTDRIQWFDMGEKTNRAQHHHAWIVFDYQKPADTPPALFFA